MSQDLDFSAVFHVPVLVEAVLSGLAVQKDAWYIDATAGGGGHSEKILLHGGNVLAIEQDAEAVAVLSRKFQKEITDGRLKIIPGNFRDLQKLVQVSDIRVVQGILFDLGMSTYQIKRSGRGFSFMRDEPLDMRMSQEVKLSAAHIINTYSEEELVTIFIRLGEERLAKQISEAIIDARREKPIETTKALGELIANEYRKKGIREKIHPATRVFQALRIAVNEELSALSQVLPQAVELLGKDGRVAVISFHSLEDRIVKQFFIKEARLGKISILTKKPIVASEAESENNPASRSAKLRIAQKH